MINQSALIDLSGPVNFQHPLARDLLSWYLAVPGLMGGAKFHDLMSPADLSLGRHGTLTNGPTWQGTNRMGGFGTLVFDGSDDYVNCSDIDTLDGLPYLSVGCWTNQAALSGDQCLVAKWTYQTQGVFGLQTNQLQSAGNVRVFIATSLSDSGAGYAEETTPGPRAAARWDHVFFTYNSSSGVTIYVNGVSIPISRTGSPPSTLTSGSTAEIQISLWNGLGRYFNGSIDDVRIYTRALSADEVRDLYQNSLAGYPELLNRTRGLHYFFQPNYDLSVSDTVTISDDAAITLIHLVNMSDTVTVSDSVAMLAVGPGVSYLVGVSDTVTVSDSAAMLAVGPGASYLVGVSDTVIVSDSVTMGLTHFVSVLDTATVSDAVSMTLAFNASVSDTVTVSDSVFLTKVFNASVSDSVTVRDSVETFRNRTGDDDWISGELFASQGLFGKLTVN